MRLTPLAALTSIGVALALLAGAWALHAIPAEGRALSLLLLLGSAFGIVLQRARFCFFCNLRDFIERREADGVLSILLSLAVGAILYTVIVMSWMPVPQPDRLPPNAHIGPVGPALAIAAFVFGIGMALSDSCISAHLYRLGEGSPTAPFALVGAAGGFVVGFLTWNPIYLALVADREAIWLPHWLGHGGALAATLAVLACIAVLVVGVARPAAMGGTPSSLAHRILVARWPASVGGIAVGVISMVAYFRIAPLGVTAEIGSLARTGASGLGILPDTLYGLDAFRGCATAVKQALLSPNGTFVTGMVAGSFAAALAAGQFRPSWPRPAQIFRGLTGGLLMGWGAMIALGCTVGVLLSGIHAGAVSGWVFLAFCTLGVTLSLPLTRRLP